MHMSAVGTKRTSRYVRYLSAFGAKLTLTEPREPPLAGRRYLRRCKEGATRVDLNGNPDGKVTADQAGARGRAQEAGGAEGLRPLRGLWWRRLPPGDGGDAGVVWDAPTGAVRASFWRATVDEAWFVPKSVPAAPCSPSASCSRFGRSPRSAGQAHGWKPISRRRRLSKTDHTVSRAQPDLHLYVLCSISSFALA